MVTNFGGNAPFYDNGFASNPLVLGDHLELLYSGLGVSADLFLNYGASLSPAMVSNISSESFSSPLFTFFSILNFLTIASFISLLLFTVTGLGNKSEWSTDVEHLVSGLSTEAEKELFSFDDAVYLLGVMCVLIVAYFGAISMGALFQQYDTSLFLLALPALFFTLVGIPLNLLFDFGLFFLMYLRGVATTKVVIFELAYDYVGVIAFFTRLLVQFVRLALMFVVYFMMHEAVMVYQIGQGAMPFAGSSYSDIFNAS
jgi:hypothetical protein